MIENYQNLGKDHTIVAKNKKWKLHIKNNIFVVVVFVLMTTYIISFLIPLIWGLLASLKRYSEYLEFPFGLPKKIYFQNYIDAFNGIAIKVKSGAGTKTVFLEEMLLYSLIYSVGGALISTVVPAIAAYLTAKYNYKFSKIVYATVIIVMIVPIVGSLPSEIQMMKNLHLYDSFLGIFIMKANFMGMYFLVFYATFKSISWEFAESAFIDGAGHFTVLFRIMLPLVKSAMFTVFILNFIGYWNDYTTSMIYMPSFPTAAFGMFYMKFVITSTFGKGPVQLAGCFILSIPLIIIYIIFQEKMMGNITVGGIKG